MGFREKLKLGNDMELVVLDFLRKCGVNIKPNNDVNVRDMDLILPDHKILLDVKFSETIFEKAKHFTGIDPEDCFTISKKAVKRYQDRENDSDNECWIAFFINYKKKRYGIFFIKNSSIFTMLQKNRDSRPTMHVDRKKCLDTRQFLNYLSRRRKAMKND